MVRTTDEVLANAPDSVDRARAFSARVYAANPRLSVDWRAAEREADTIAVREPALAAMVLIAATAPAMSYSIIEAQRLADRAFELAGRSGVLGALSVHWNAFLSALRGDRTRAYDYLAQADALVPPGMELPGATRIRLLTLGALEEFATLAELAAAERGIAERRARSTPPPSTSTSRPTRC